MRWSFNNPDSSGLSFSKPQDALDCACQIAQDAKNWHTAKDWNPAKSYAEGHVNVVLTGCIGGRSLDYDLIFSAIPSRTRRPKDVGKRGFRIGVPNKFNLSHIDARLNDSPMFMGIGKFVQSPERRIPSFIRLESHKQRLDFWRDVLGFGFEVTLKFSPRVAEGEGRSPFESSPAGPAAGAIPPHPRRPRARRGCP